MTLKAVSLRAYSLLLIAVLCPAPQVLKTIQGFQNILHCSITYLALHQQYAMATEQLEDLEIVEETPPTMPSEQEPKKLSPTKKKPGPHNPDHAPKFVVENTQSVD